MVKLVGSTVASLVDSMDVPSVVLRAELSVIQLVVLRAVLSMDVPSVAPRAVLSVELSVIRLAISRAAQ